MRLEHQRFLLYALILLGGALRLWGIGEKSLWVDEAQALWISQHSVKEILAYTSQSRSHESPARHLVTHALLPVIPNQVFALRLPALIAGIALIPLAWILTGRFSGQSFTGKFSAALLTALSPILVEHSQDGRQYTVMLALAFGAVAAMLSARARPSAWPLWMATGLLAAFSLYISFTAAPVFGAVSVISLLWTLTHARRGHTAVWRGALLALGCLCVPLLPWAPEIARTALRFAGVLPPPEGQVFTLGDTALGTAWHPQWRAELLREIVHPLVWIAPIGVALALLGYFRVGRVNRTQALLVALVAGFTLILALGTEMRHNLAPRYFLPVHALGLILAGCGAALIGAANPARIAIAWLVVVFVAAGMIPALAVTLTRERQDWKQAVAFIENNFQPGDVIITGAYWSERPVQHYLRRPEARASLRPNIMAESDFNRQVLLNARIWYIGWGETPPFIQQILDRSFVHTGDFPGMRGDVYVWKKGP